MSSAAEKRQVFYTNMLLLGFDGTVPPPHAPSKSKVIAFNVDMFKVPNRSAFEVVILFLFTKLNPTRAKEEFRDCWPPYDKKREQMFRRVCNGWLSQISQDESDSYLPKIVPSIFQSPGGDRFCNLMFSFSNYVLTQVMKHEHGVKGRDMLLKPMLSPQNMELAAAMTQSVQCSAISSRKRFFERIQTRESLHKTWQKSASEMVRDYRRLNQGLRQVETDIKSLLDQHTEKGFRSPVRRDRIGKSVTPASKHGRVFDVNVESVRRDEKVQKVRELWDTVEGFLSATHSQQEVVSSILSGVVHKYILKASELDLRVPEMLLRECERELLKRDIGNTYKAGKLDLVSTLHLWNLSLHLYLERLEDGDRLDLTNQLRDIQPKLRGLNAQIDDSRQLGSSLRDELIPEIKESIRQVKTRHEGRDRKEYSSKLGMTFQPDTPPLSFDPNKASDADVQAARMTFTPDMLSQESTPDAVAKIMKSVNRAMQPQRLACKDLTNQQSEKSSAVPQGSVISPLAQGRLVRTRHTDLASTSCGDRTGSNIQISRVGSKQVTKVLKESLSNEGGLFSSPDDTPHLPNRTAEDGAFRPNTSSQAPTTTPTSSRAALSSSRRERDLAINRLYSKVDQLPTSFVRQESPSDVLAARIAQSIIEVGDVDRLSPTEEQLSRSAADSLYSVSNVLDELGVSGFSSRDKIGRTPDTSAGASISISSLAERDVSGRGKVIFADAQKPSIDMLSDEEDNIVTVETQETERSSYSEGSSKQSSSPGLADNSSDVRLTGTSEVRNTCSTYTPSNTDRSTAGVGVVSSGAHMSDSLTGHVYWTPDSGNRFRVNAGRRIVDGVLDEQPLFVDSPMLDSFNADDVDADLLDLLPPDSSLHESSGFQLSLGTGSSPRPAGSGSEMPPSLQVQSTAAPPYTMEEIMAQFEQLKQMTAAAAANQQSLATAASNLSGMSPANQRSAATSSYSFRTAGDKVA